MVDLIDSIARLRMVRVMIVSAALLAPLAIGTAAVQSQPPPAHQAQGDRGLKAHGAASRLPASRSGGHGRGSSRGRSGDDHGWGWGRFGDGHGWGHEHHGHRWCDPDPEPEPPKPVPSADFVYTPIAPVAGRPVTFDASASIGGVAGDLTGTIAKYDWAFGDQTPVETTTTPTASHTFAAAGDFEVSLTVTNDYGASDTIVRAVHVVRPPPVYTPGPGPQSPGPSGADGPATVLPGAPAGVVVGRRGSKRIRFRTSIGFAVPAGLDTETSCVGTVTLRGSLRRVGRVAAAAPLRAAGGRCTARFRVSLPAGFAGQSIKFKFAFGGNSAVAPWKLIKTLAVQRPR
ncbi:MAG: PKD domain-containing protein [Solirubrobacterales bacterium]